MAMANMNLIGVFVPKLWPVQALACGGGGDGGDGGDGDQKHNIIEIFKFRGYNNDLDLMVSSFLTFYFFLFCG